MAELHSSYQVRWKNFKGFKDTGWIKIKPLTILLGNNNTGKTSFLAPFLLMNQTLSSQDNKSPIIIKGSLYDGGNIQELCHNYTLEKDIFWGFRYHHHETGKRLKKVGTYPPGAIEVTFGVDNISNKEIIVKRQTIYDMYEREFFSLSRNKLNEYSLSGLYSDKLSTEETNALKKVKPINFLFTPNSLIQMVIREQKGIDEQAKIGRFSDAFSRVLSVVSFNISEFRDIINNLSFIGPIREIPRRYYEIGNENYITVGHRGENMPTLLKKHYDQIKDDLNSWIQKFSFGDILEFVPLSVSGDLYSIRFKDENSSIYTNIANAGFGASQVLPLIVQALVSPKNSLTIAEQPEIHLNPKLQCVLADLFAFMVNKDQRVIIETHSEHMLLRLRVLMASKQISSEDVAIYFIEKKKGESSIREVKVEENGHILPVEWPKGFFEDSMRESLALAIEQMKSNVSTNKQD